MTEDEKISENNLRILFLIAGVFAIIFALYTIISANTIIEKNEICREAMNTNKTKIVDKGGVENCCFKIGDTVDCISYEEIKATTFK